MKKKTISMLACALLMPALALWAQEEAAPASQAPQAAAGEPQPEQMSEPKEHPMLAERYMEMLDKRLTLSSEQKAKIKETIAGAKAGLLARTAAGILGGGGGGKDDLAQGGGSDVSAIPAALTAIVEALRS